MKMALPQVIPGVLSGVFSALNEAATGIDFYGQRFVPDESTAYCEFRCAYAFPEGISVYGDVLLPEVLRASAGSMLHKPLNLRHQMKRYDAENIPRDRIIGSIVAVREAREGAGAWHLHGIAAMFKNAEGVDRILGGHGSGRTPWTVSMEFAYNLGDSGFVFARNEGEAPLAGTPDWLARAGWNYAGIVGDARSVWMADQSCATLLAERDFEGRKFKKRSGRPGHPYAGEWQGRPVYFAMGGLQQAGHFSGLAHVEHGAELTARIERMLAADPGFTAAMERLESIQKISDKFVLPNFR
jgi:hypothetical protein